jgi:hypothetical protein
VPYRDEDDKRHLRVTGDLGQIVPMVSSVPLIRPISSVGMLKQTMSSERNGIYETRSR